MQSAGVSAEAGARRLPGEQFLDTDRESLLRETAELSDCLTFGDGRRV